VDFIFHAGDVGELWVIDQLSSIAPVFAVHGNDDSDDSQRELPYQHMVAAAGRRILLTHSHFPNRDDEWAFRKLDGWGGKLDRRSNMARRAGASICVFGHSHVPMVKVHEGVLLVNPGAIASGNLLTKQTLRSVAMLDLSVGQDAGVTHINIADGKPFVPHIDWDAGYRVAYNNTQESILPEWLRERWDQLNTIALPEWPRFRAALLRAGSQVWSGALPLVTPELLLSELDKEPLPEAVRAQVRQVLTQVSWTQSGSPSSA